jgi:hypothetical protein
MRRTSGFIFLFLPALLIFCCSDNISPEKKALQLAKIFIMENGLPAGKNIERMIEAGGNDVTSHGWVVEKMDDQVYLVSFKYSLYSLEKGIGEQGYFFEVDPVKDTVKNVTEQHLKKMRPLSGPYKNDQEMTEGVMNNLESQ